MPPPPAPESAACGPPPLPRKQSSRGGNASMPRFPSLLLQELAGITVAWGPQQRLLAHQLLLQLLPLAMDGLREQQASVLLSAAWHEAALGDSPPAAYVALDSTLRTLLGAAPAASLPQVVKMLAALQAELLRAGAASSPGSSPGGTPHADGVTAAEESHFAELSPAQACALLCVCASVLHALAAQLGQPALQQLAVPGAEGVLQQLVSAPPHGLLLQAAGGSRVAAPSNGGSVEAAAAQQQFWQRDALAVAFSGEEQQRAAAFLVQWRLASSLEAQQASLAAALAAVPLFKQQQKGDSGRFRPMPLSSLMPRMQQVRRRAWCEERSVLARSMRTSSGGWLGQQCKGATARKLPSCLHAPEPAVFTFAAALILSSPFPRAAWPSPCPMAPTRRRGKARAAGLHACAMCTSTCDRSACQTKTASSWQVQGGVGRWNVWAVQSCTTDGSCHPPAPAPQHLTLQLPNPHPVAGHHFPGGQRCG